MSENTPKLPPLPEGFSYGDLTPDGFIQISCPPNGNISLAYLENLLSVDPVSKPLTFLAIVLGGVIMQEFDS
ncbi:MAG: hypothetical protein ABII80_00260 [bacterium]